MQRQIDYPEKLFSCVASLSKGTHINVVCSVDTACAVHLKALNKHKPHTEIAFGGNRCVGVQRQVDYPEKLFPCVASLSKGTQINVLRSLDTAFAVHLKALNKHKPHTKIAFGG